MKKISNKTTVAQRLPIPRQGTLIEHEMDGAVIGQRPFDGYIDATAMCKKAEKFFNDYSRLSSTEQFLAALSTNMGIPVTGLSTDTGIPVTGLIHTLRGGNDPKMQGTWVHPKVAIHLAQWLSPQFAVQVSTWVFDWMQGKTTGYMPVHVKRYMANRAKVPPTHFSMLNEIYLHLIAPLEEEGFILPEKMVPDASTGRMFSGFLRRNGINPDSFPTYTHEFLYGRRQKVQARLYPNEYLAAFRKYFHGTWLPNRALGYFGERAPNALPYVKSVIAALPAPKNIKNKS